VTSVPKFSIVFLLLSLQGCDDESSTQDGDPLRDAEVVSCDMPLDHACIEYDRVRRADTTGFVVLDEARSICAQGWPGGSPAAGSFGEGACPTDTALARCRIVRNYVEVHYYDEGFADTSMREDPLTALGALCSKSGGSLEIPPF
jgi:hypothetical protein